MNKESGKVLIAGFRVEGQWRATTCRGTGLCFRPGAQMHATMYNLILSLLGNFSNLHHSAITQTTEDDFARIGIIFKLQQNFVTPATLNDLTTATLHGFHNCYFPWLEAISFGTEQLGPS